MSARRRRVVHSFAGLDRNIDSIKGKARLLLCWVDEGEPVTEEAWVKLIPTLREEDSELWVTWNPENEKAPVHKRFRLSTDPRAKVVEMNWRDNPWFPDILNRQRLKDKRSGPTVTTISGRAASSPSSRALTTPSN
jgi:phage terminase large subunit